MHRVAGTQVGDAGRVQRTDDDRPPGRAEREHMRQHAAVREHLRRIAEGVDERLVEPPLPYEVVADATNVLALECALRRRELLRSDPRARDRVRMGATHRVTRAQQFEGRGTMAHFALLSLCTAGRDEGSLRFETSALVEQIEVHLDVLTRVREVGCHVSDVRVSVTDLTGGRHRDALRERVVDRLAAGHPDVSVGFDENRQHGTGYYVDACFEIHARTPDGAELSIADGGLTRWTAALLHNAKERLAISGLGIERLLAEFGSDRS